MKTLYLFLLKLYPARFREEFGGSLERHFADECRDAEGTRDRLLLWLRAFTDLAATLPAELAREVRQDLRYAGRIYRRRSLVTGMALAALALAIGATTGVFSVVNALLIRSLPFYQPERLVQVQTPPVSPTTGRKTFSAWRDSLPYLDGVAGYFPTEMNVALGERTIRVPIAETSADFFRLLGTVPEYGRTFTADEDLAGQDSVAVISHGFWQRYFGGDSRALGSTIRVNGVPLTVIGVAPPNLDFPGKTEVWSPTLFDFAHLPKQGVSYGDTVGRLKSGISLSQARAMFEADVRNRNSKALAYDGANHPALIPLQERLAGPIRQASFVLLGLVVFVLLVACANVAHLLLSRTAERRRELMIRSALGASRARLVQQLIVESSLLTLMAAGAGLGVAHWAARVAAAAQPAELLAQNYDVLDWRVLAFAVGVALATGFLFGVLPAILIGRTQPTLDPMRSQSAGRSSGASRMRSALVTLQSALTLVLVVGALIMGSGFRKLLDTDLGYQTSSVVTLNVSLAGTRWDTATEIVRYYQEALARLRAVPGVESAAAAQYLPLMHNVYMGGSFDLDSGGNVVSIEIPVTADYFRTMRTEVLDGREFTEADGRNSDRVAIVNEAFARQIAPGQRLPGRKLTTKWPPGAKPFTIVGVVRTARTVGPAQPGRPQIFFSAQQWPPGFATLVARVHGNPQALMSLCRDIVQQVDPHVPVFDVKTLDERLTESIARPRFYTTAVLFLGGFALLLAVIGIYGVASYSIAQRTNEIGIRVAVGASPSGVRVLLLRQGLTPLLVGLAAGVAAAIALGKSLQHLMSSAQPIDGWTCAGAALLLAATAATAIWSATRRIERLDPMAALRAE